MIWRYGFIGSCLFALTNCGRIVDTDGSYVLAEGGSSSQTGGAAGGTSSDGAGGGVPCKTNTECPKAGLVCVSQECINGFCRIQSTAEGAPCASSESSVCDGQGHCVQCTQPAHCTSIVEDQCAKRACIGNTCQTQFLSQEFPAGPAQQLPGDCKVVVCDGFGGTKTVHDDSDTPNDDNGCTTDTCLNGSEVHVKVPMGTPCGTNSVCDASGQCVGCLQPSDCLGMYDFCKDGTCQSGICGIKYTPNGTVLPSNEQTAQDCYVMVCDGSGNKVTRVDANDGPADGNPCTRDSCTAEGSPTYPPEAAGAPCSDGENDMCDGLGTCKKSNGKPCTSDDECVNAHCTDGVCCENACDTPCSTCNLSPLTAGTCTSSPSGQADANASAPCTGASVCDGNGSCKKNDGQACTGAVDCLHGNCVDNVCCESACMATCKACNVAPTYGVCTNVPRGMKDDNASAACNATQACNGSGVCKLANGQQCTGPSECASNKCIGSPKLCQP